MIDPSEYARKLIEDVMESGWHRATNHDEAPWVAWRVAIPGDGPRLVRVNQDTGEVSITAEDAVHDQTHPPAS